VFSTLNIDWMKMTSTTATAAKAKAKATTQRSNIMFFFAVLAMAAPSVEATRLAFHFDGLKHASCSSGTFKMDLNELKFKCNGEWDLCRPGDEVVVQGWCKFTESFLVLVFWVLDFGFAIGGSVNDFRFHHTIGFNILHFPNISLILRCNSRVAYSHAH